ncbi:NAD(P)/FAD-dependent oxidoreductase [Acidianus brierleyi]|uniref:FAD-dependent oxidoreductase n=1 Tax=Acidianus brierleyi TaxID=41673 RepID=A0A2U9IIE1_9CREN|nr:NAD(P)/FAD-dependent oxidoreductase [Acidianus brierleyi]AWR95797.1 FAD-dependent oxidoreductase [Acidianus brierleyi]
MKFDVIVVGAGPSGSAASLTAAKAGMKVLTLERGPEPGSKNVSGAMVRLSEVAKVFDVNGVPFEREVKRVRLLLSSEKGDIRIDTYPKTKLLNVSRLKFDKYLSQQAENAGTLLITKTTALGIKKEGEYYRVITDRGEIEGDKVVLAEGANALVSMNIGIRPEFSPTNTVQAVKEVYTLGKDEVNKRFQLQGDTEGESWRVIASDPVPYAGFLYVYKDSVSIGVGVPMQTLIDKKMRPYEVLDSFEKKFGINELVKGGSLREYSAKIIPEQGFPEWKSCMDGIYSSGDAIGLINPLVFNGIGPAIISGSLAGKASVENWDCRKFALELMNVKEIREISKLRPLVKELLGKGYLSVYDEFLTNIAESWASGDLSELTQYKEIIPTLLKHVLLLWGGIA